MYKIDQAPDVLFRNVQIQPCKFESLESCNESVEVNLRGSDSSSDQHGITMSTTEEATINGLVTMASLSEYVKSCCSQISNRLMNKVRLRVFVLFYFAKDDVYNFLSVSMKS